MSFGFGLSFPAWLVLSGSGGAPFSPLSLFSSGEQGAWYDPSDTATLFTDSAGTTPVTAVEQPVGLILDKSKGLVLGSELVTNGTFDTDTTGWTAATGTIAAVGGELEITSDGVSVGRAEQVITGLVVGRWYQFTGTLRNGTGVVRFRLGTTSNGTQYTSYTTQGDKSLLFAATGTTLYISPQNSTIAAGTTSYYDNISVRELPGNHAFQTDSAKRPLWSSRVNLLTRTEEFNDAVWGKSSVTSVTSTANESPTGTTPADLILFAAAGRIGQAITVPAGVTVQASIRVKRVNRDFHVLAVASASTSVNNAAIARFNLQTLALETTETAGTGFTLVGTPTIAASTNGYVVLSMQVTVAGTTAALYTSSTANTTNNTASAGAEVYLWGADLRVANESSALPPYQRVVTATDYDTTGFVPFLRFDGSNDALVTNSINFTATDEMSVFAGVRILGNATYGGIVGLGATVNDAGSMMFWQRSSAGGGQPEVYARGSTSSTTGSVLGNAPTGIPSTSLYTLAFDISQPAISDEIVLRQNAAPLDGTGSLSAGTGTFANAVMTIGQYNNANPYNGRLFSLIVLGRTVTPTELTQTEGYVEAKTFGKDMAYVFYEVLNGPDGDQLTVTAGGDDLYVYKQYE